MSTPPNVRKGHAPARLEREAFLARIAEIAWHNYRDARKAPHTVKAGPEFAGPSYPGAKLRNPRQK